MSGQVTLYRKAGVLVPVGAVKVFAIEESPLVGEADPSRAA
ncbi:hypothetical protein ACFV1W_22775 [Kitasatospora sp. NPDC059648]